jgi:hypothetical protein
MNVDEIILEKENIINLAIEFLRKNFPTRTVFYDKCRRDIGLIIDAYIHDIVNNTVLRTTYIGSKFWVRNKRQIIDYNAEFAVHNFVVDYIIKEKKVDLDLAHRLYNLKNILFLIIEHGPSYDPIGWEKIISTRFNTYNWKEEAPSKDVIDSILQELHDYSPSKQRAVRYSIKVLRNNNKHLKKLIYESTEAEPHNPNSRYNPQVLAPWLLVFGIRNEANTKNVEFNYFQAEAYMDIGIAANFISLSASSKSTDVGFCACIQNREKVEKSLGIFPHFYLGIGYRDNIDEYFCLVKNQYVPVPNSDLHQKPSMESYISYV